MMASDGVTRGLGPDIVLRILVKIAFVLLRILPLPPFERVIQPEAQWMYRYPNVPAIINYPVLLAITFGAPVLIVGLFFVCRQRSLRESWEALLVPSLAVPLAGVFTSVIQLVAGTPRPDFFDRCYPGIKNFDASQPCTGDYAEILDGKRSFPSDHASLLFASFIFVAAYMAGQLGIFHSQGRRYSWRLLSSIAPLVLAICLAATATCDYQNHWHDVAAGMVFGSIVGYAVYRQYFPSVFSQYSQYPFSSLDARKQLEAEGSL